MTILVPLVMFGWIPAVLLMVSLMPSRKAVVVAFVVAWSFLPVLPHDFYHIQGLPAYTKMSATCGGVLLAAVCFDFGKLVAFRPALLDLPMIVWCLCPCASSLSNGLGLYDGVSSAFAQTVTWGFPYFIARIYLGDLNGLRELAMGMFWGGIVYVPLCLFEMRMSPQLHHWIYGYFAHEDFAQNMRFGGWRPTVFMEHGLMVGMWMSMSALVGLWLWWTRASESLWNIPSGVLASAVLLTAILCKSMGALVLLAAGFAALAALKNWGTRVVLWILIAIAPAYIAMRVTKIWDGSQLEEAAAMVSSDRSQSFQFRIMNENLLVDKAMVQPIFGWGGWGRNLISDTKGNFRTVVDGQWINVLGLYGTVGLASFMATLLLPPVLLLKRFPISIWSRPMFGSVAALMTVNVLYMIDNIPNAMVNPIYMLSAGAMSGLLLCKTQATVSRETIQAQVRRVARQSAVPV